MIVGTAGHIDHGKTALVKALTGVDTDRLAEEKRRGITIDLGFAYRPLAAGTTLGFVDVPGHERFIHNMLAGAIGIDHMLLVIAVDDGVMAQTIEHLHILDLLGVTNGAVVLTKIDRVAPERVVAVGREIEALLVDTALAGCPHFPVSSVTGAGIAEVLRHLAAAADGFRARPRGGHFRLAIDRCFALPGHGTVVTGTAFAGRVAPGDELIVSPSGLAVRVRAIHSGNQPAAAGSAGERLALNLAGPRVEKAAIRRGEWVVAPPLHAPSERFDARLRMLASAAKALGQWTPVHVHLGCADLMARIALLDGPIAPGKTGLVQVVLDRPAPVLAGDRFIVRDQSAQCTLGGGRVIDPFAPARRRSRPERLAHLRALAVDSAQDAAVASLALPPFYLDAARFELARNLTSAQAGAFWRELAVATLDAGRRRFVVARDHLAALQESVLAALAAQPMTPTEVAATLATPCPRVILNAAIELLVRERRIQRHGPRLALPAALAAAEEDPLWPAIEALLAGAPCRPLPVTEIAGALKVAEAQALRTLAALAARGKVFRTAAGHYMLRRALAQLAGIAEALARDPAGLELAQFRARTGCSRRAAVEILEYFDRMGMTARRGEIRLVRRSARDIFGF